VLAGLCTLTWGSEAEKLLGRALPRPSADRCCWLLSPPLRDTGPRPDGGEIDEDVAAEESRMRGLLNHRTGEKPALATQAAGPVTPCTWHPVPSLPCTPRLIRRHPVAMQWLGGVHIPYALLCLIPLGKLLPARLLHTRVPCWH
jgi:hypothetical protein